MERKRESVGGSPALLLALKFFVTIKIGKMFAKEKEVLLEVEQRVYNKTIAYKLI